MKRFTVVTFTLLAVVAALLSGCRSAQTTSAEVEDPWGVVTIPAGEPVKVLVSTALNEEVVGPEGLEQQRGVQLSAANRTIQGHTVELIESNSGCDAGRAAGIAVNQTIYKDIAGVIGNTCSSACSSAGDSFESAHFTMVSPGCSAPVLVDQVLHLDVFTRTIYDDALEATLAARFAYNEMGARHAAVVDDGTPETIALSEAFEAAFSSLGGSVVTTQQINRGEETFRSTLAELAPAEPDVIYAPLLVPDGAKLVLQMNATSLSGTQIIGGRHFASDWFIQAAGSTADGVRAVVPLVDEAAYAEFSNAYNQEYGEAPDGPAAAFGYDAANLLLNAMEEAAVVAPSGDLQIGRQALRNALGELSAQQGVTGLLTCTEWGDCSAGQIGVAQVQNGSWQTIYIP